MPTVLVVDDQPGVRLIAKLTLEMEGVAVCEAANGLEALEALAHEPIDLMVLDLDMPVMDGHETFQEARREGFEGPIMILSGFGAQGAAKQLDADDGLEKPFDPDELVTRVNDLLSQPLGASASRQDGH